MDIPPKQGHIPWAVLQILDPKHRSQSQEEGISEDDPV